MSSGIIDLRPRSGRRRVPAGQTSLFATRAPQAPKRPLPLRARKRRVRAAIALGVLLTFTAVAWGVHYLSYLPQFNVQEMSIQGAQNLRPRLVRDYVATLLEDGTYHFFSRTNIFLYPHADIERDIPRFFPRVKEVHVTRESLLSAVVIVQLEERQPFANWCQLPREGAASDCYLMDDGGFVFAHSSSTSSSSGYIFYGSLATSSSPIGQTYVRAHLPALVALLTSLGQAGFMPQGTTVENNTDFSVPLKGFLLKASFGEDANMLVKNLKLVLSSDSLTGKGEQLEYVDLRFGDRVYFKLKGQTEVSGQP